ncbi:hypothetical protein Tco_1239887, partial [Tanacetum coccineum]
DSSKSEVIKEESKEEVQEESKEEESTRKRKLGTRKKMKSRKRRFIQNTFDDDSEKENDELRLYLTIALDVEEVNQNVMIRSNGQKRYFSTLMRVLSIFDRDDLNAVYQLEMDRYQDEIPERFDRVLWGDLMIMFNPDDEDKFWNSQQDYNIAAKIYSFRDSQTVLTSTTIKVNTVKPIVNRVKPTNVFHKTHSSSSRPFKKTTVLRTDFSNQKLNTAKDYPHRALKNKRIVDSGCSRHMTRNKAYLAEFQDFNGGPVAFGAFQSFFCVTNV